MDGGDEDKMCFRRVGFFLFGLLLLLCTTTKAWLVGWRNGRPTTQPGGSLAKAQGSGRIEKWKIGGEYAGTPLGDAEGCDGRDFL